MEIPGGLIITKAVLENFKSYAGTIMIDPFHASFTAVVCLNGSGKYNLLESLLFSFGKRAKRMRRSRLSELIHKFKAFPSLKYAKVDVYIQNIIDDPQGSSTVPDFPSSYRGQCKATTLSKTQPYNQVYSKNCKHRKISRTNI